ncbi:hypothetical protein DFQ03_1195 [Maribacter caenipelagi]|uniref:Uncharacterized protein n=1 Tax=Maribacter caenipelagi TaxID=1447781 RepID=A0A4R7D8J2_9FLAO|nr:hypothetical protein DFQ03_1195 [Maribacter caenipelagi]
MNIPYFDIIRFKFSNKNENEFLDPKIAYRNT